MEPNQREIKLSKIEYLLDERQGALAELGYKITFNKVVKNHFSVSWDNISH